MPNDPTPLLAERSIQWQDVDKVSFLWDTELVLLYVDRENGTYRILTDLREEIQEDLFNWLNRAFTSGKFDTNDDEESWD